MAKAPPSQAPDAPGARIREIKATFLGYQAAGKSTFLTAALPASGLGRLRSDASGRALGVTEKIEQGELSFFASPVHDRGLSRLDLLRRGEQVPKTGMDGWLQIRLALEFAGRAPFDCITFDYTGELAAVARMDREQLRLQENIQTSDCLYLFFDASLRRGQDQDELFARRHQGQGEAIQWAYQGFTEARRGWPIVLVVTKADLLFAGKSKEEIAAQIGRLNGRGSEAVERGKQVFREFMRRQGAEPLAEVLLANLSRMVAGIRALEGGSGRSAIALEILYAWWRYATLDGPSLPMWVRRAPWRG